MENDAAPLVLPSRWSPVPGPHSPLPPVTYLLKLYIAGRGARAEAAIANLQQLCENELRGQFELEVIDILEHPERAEQAKILATPTLIKQLPPPLRRVIGDLSDREKLLLGLDVRPIANKPAANPDMT